MDIYDIRRANLQRLLKAKFDGKQARLADAIDRSANYISRCLTESSYRKRIGEDFARHIEKSVGLDSGWLDIDRSDIDYRADQKVVREGLAERSYTTNVATAPAITGMVPEISWVQAGAWTEVCHVELDPESVNWYPRPPGASERTFVLRVVGESMMPEYTPGRLIFVDPERAANSGDDVVAILTDTSEATFKRFIEEPGSGKMLKALNPAWHEPYITINGNCRVVGVVVADMRMR